MIGDFVYKQILSGGLEAGIPQSGAENAARIGLKRYKTCDYKGKGLDLIVDCIKTAKRDYKNQIKKGKAA